MRKDTQTHTHLTRARDRDAETPYKNSSTDIASDTRDLYVLIVAITYIPLSRVHNENANEATCNHVSQSLLQSVMSARYPLAYKVRSISLISVSLSQYSATSRAPARGAACVS